MKNDKKVCPFCNYDANNNVEKLCGFCEAKAINERVKWWQEGKKKLKDRNGH